jgi:osmotically-inducible protein OsmY
VCIEEAKVARAKAEADAVAQHKAGDAKDLRKAREKVAKAEYSLAKEKCDDQSGNAKKACKLDAKAAEDAALADAKRSDTTPTLGERTTAAVDTTRDRTTAATNTAVHNTADTARNATAATSDAVSDAVITTKVKADLAAEPGVKAMDVHVETAKGVVMLSGFVPSKEEADKAVQVARNVKGVTDVKSSIQVKK